MTKIVEQVETSLMIYYVSVVNSDRLLYLDTMKLFSTSVSASNYREYLLSKLIDYPDGSQVFMEGLYTQDKELDTIELIKQDALAKLTPQEIEILGL